MAPALACQQGGLSVYPPTLRLTAPSLASSTKGGRRWAAVVPSLPLPSPHRCVILQPAEYEPSSPDPVGVCMRAPA